MKKRNLRRNVLLVVLLSHFGLFAQTGCKSVVYSIYPPDAGEIISASITDSMDGNRSIDVLFATNRKASGLPDCSGSHYGIENTGSLIFAKCTVHVPRNHNIGSLSTGDYKQNPDVYFGAENHKSLKEDEWFDEISGENVLVFVHGFNVPFEEALIRAAQIKYDSKFQGPVVLFTWPAGSSNSIIDNLLMRRVYEHNQKNAQNSIDLFHGFIQKLSAKADRADIVVHSMGHQIVIPALLREGSSGKRVANEVVFNSPDYPADDFVRGSPVLKRTAKRITIYCSPGDNALQASRVVNRNYRIGMCKRVAGIDVINVNEIDAPAMGVGGLGHGYYSGRPLMTDLFQLLLGMPAEKRLFIRKSDAGHGEDFVLRD